MKRVDTFRLAVGILLIGAACFGFFLVSGFGGAAGAQSLGPPGEQPRTPVGTPAPYPSPSFAPPLEERQLPRAMHSAMQERPIIRVGARGGDLIGSDNRALQAAVDYMAALGGGTVEIGEGVYLMRDSLHLRSHVTVRGQGEKTVLRKAPGAISPLAADGDFGEQQITVRNPQGFQVGDGVTIWDAQAGCFDFTVARITGRSGDSFSISRPLMADFLLERNAQAATVFPVVSGSGIEEAKVEGLTIDGNRDKNVLLNGCRGGGIYLNGGFGTIIEKCVVRNFNGDGISFQGSNDVQVIACLSENNADLGIHPGGGSQRPVVRDSVARHNGHDGLFLCWRVRHGLFESNELLENGRYGISIGHEDTDNLLRNNLVRGNAGYGVYFRDEPAPYAGHRNRLENNRIEGNGRGEEAAGIMVDGETSGTVLKANEIREPQGTGIRLGKKSGSIILEANRISAGKELEDLRPPRKQ